MEAADFAATPVVAIVVVAAKNDVDDVVAVDLHMVDLVAMASKAVDTDALVVVLEAAAVVVALEAAVVVADVHILEGVQGILQLHVVLSFHDETLLADVGIPHAGLL